MSGTIANLELGPCTVRWGTSGSEVDLGFTKGGVKIAVDSPTVNVTTDQFGQVIMKQILVGRTAQITVPFAETSLSLFATIIPGASYVSGGGAKKVLINTPVGMDLVASLAAALLITKAIGNTESTLSGDKFRFFKTAPTGRIEFGFDLENQRVYQVEFFAYPDQNVNFALGEFGNASAA